MDAEVTVFPVPGGPWMRPRGRCRTVLMACICELFNFGRLGADNLTTETKIIRYGTIHTVREYNDYNQSCPDRDRECFKANQA